MICTEFEWRGFKGVDFDFDGLNSKLVRPNVESNGKWALKTEYFDAFPEVEIELLNRGWHIAYNKNYDRWAQDRDVIRKCDFIKFISSEFKLDKKCAIIGMSCGGMYGVKVAAIVPELISALYLDAPVINLLSCPCGLGVATDSLFEEFHGFTGKSKSQMLSYRDNPLDKLDILVKNKIPVILVAGDSDTVVPYCENGALVEEYYKNNGGHIEVHIKPGCGHHPHGLVDSKIIANFLGRF